MQLNNITVLLLDIKHVNITILTIGPQILNLIHGLILNQTHIHLLKILAEVFVWHKKHPIITSKRLLRTVWKPLLVLVFKYRGPEFLIALVALTIPLVLAPWVPQFQHAVGLVLLVLENLCADLSFSEKLPYCNMCFMLNRFISSSFTSFLSRNLSGSSFLSIIAGTSTLSLLTTCFTWCGTFRQDNIPGTGTHQSAIHSIYWHNPHEPWPMLFK